VIGLLFRVQVLSGLLCISANSSFAVENLLDVYVLAVASDPQLKQVQLELSIATESRRINFSRFLPNISVSGDVTNNLQKRTYDVSQFDGEEEYNSYSYALSLNQPLFRYDNHVSYKQAADRIKQTNTELVAARQALIVRLSERYFDVLAAQDNLRFIDAEKRAVERQLEQAETWLNGGLAAITDVYEARAQLDTTKSLEIDAQIQLENSLESLRELTNRHHNKLKPLSKSLVLVESELLDIEEWVELALTSNLQIASLRYNNQMLRWDISRQRTGHYPTLDLVANYSKLNSGGGNFGRSDTETRSVALQFNLPLYQGGLVTGRVKEAVFLYEQNLEKLDATIRAVRSEVRKAYFGVTGSAARMMSLQQSVISNSKALKAIEAGRKLGMRTIGDVLSATQKVYQAERDHERVRYDYVLNGLRLQKSAGILSLVYLEKINLWLE